jgi:hypothetical protein
MSNPQLSPTQRSDKPNKPLSVENPLENGGKTPPPGEIPDGLAKLMLAGWAEMEPKRDRLIPVQDLRIGPFQPWARASAPSTRNPFSSPQADGTQGVVGVGIGRVMVGWLFVMLVAVLPVTDKGQRHAIALAGPGAFALTEGAALHQALDMVVMAVLGPAHLLLKAQHLVAVLAKAAIHRRLTQQHLFDPLDEGLQHLGMVAQVAGLHKFHLGMVRRHQLAVLDDATDQHPGEQEIGEDHDAAKAQAHQMAQARFNQGKSHP